MNFMVSSLQMLVVGLHSDTDYICRLRLAMSRKSSRFDLCQDSFGKSWWLEVIQLTNQKDAIISDYPILGCETLLKYLKAMKILNRIIYRPLSINLAIFPSPEQYFTLRQNTSGQIGHVEPFATGICSDRTDLWFISHYTNIESVTTRILCCSNAGLRQACIVLMHDASVYFLRA